MGLVNALAYLVIMSLIAKHHLDFLPLSGGSRYGYVMATGCLSSPLSGAQEYRQFDAMTPEATAAGFCNGWGWRLAAATANSIRHIEKAVWVSSCKVSRSLIPAGITIFYRNGKRCCLKNSTEKICNPETCDRIADVLCRQSSRKANSRGKYPENFRYNYD